MKRYLQQLFSGNSIAVAKAEDKGAWRLLESLPLLVPVFAASFGLIAVFLLCLGRLTSLLVLLFALPAAIAVTLYAAAHLRLRLPGTVRERRAGMVAVLVFICVWTGVNMRYYSEDVYINRDPGLYTVTGRWLMDNDNLVIYETDVFGDSRLIAADTAGFGQSKPVPDGRLYAQAPHLLPTIIGLVGRVAGPDAMLRTNVAIGAFALLSVYGFTRIFVRPRWAILSVFVLAISLPMFYFSRDMYTEPLAMMLIFGALSCLAAVRVSKDYWLWAVAGLVAAAGTLARLDAYILLAGFTGAAALFLVLEKRAKGQRPYARLFSFTGAAVATGLVGWWDVSSLSKRYFTDLQSEFKAQVVLATAAFALGLVALYLERKNKLISKLFTRLGRHKKILLGIILAIVVLFATFVVSRPLWMTAHEKGNVYSRIYIAALQARDGETVDRHRNYAEYSAQWVTWYIGPAVALLGVAGFLLGVALVFEKRGQDLLPILLIFFLMAVLYFPEPKITADQIWAIRRFMPVIIPALCVFAAIALQQLFETTWPKIGRQKALQVVLVLVALGTVVIPPIATSAPFVKNKEFAGHLAQIERVCEALPRRSAVLLLGQNGINMTQTIRAYCHVPAARMPNPTRQALAEASQNARQNGYVPVVYVIGYEVGLAVDDLADITDMGVVAYQEMRRELLHSPRVVEHFTRHILIGELRPDGQVVPIK